MRQVTTLFLGISLLCGAGAGCDRPADPEFGSPTDDVLDEVKLTPVHESTHLRDGEYFTYKAVGAGGRHILYRYRMEDGELVPINAGPELSVIEAQNLGVIPVQFGDGDGEPLRRAAWSGGGSAPADASRQWETQRTAVDIPRLQVDSSYRVQTTTYVEQLEQMGRTVQSREHQETGPSRAVALTEITIAGGGSAEVYQFDDATDLEVWYRFLHQFHESLGWETTSQIEVSGMTLLRTDPDFATDARQVFAGCSRTTLSN